MYSLYFKCSNSSRTNGSSLYLLVVQANGPPDEVAANLNPRGMVGRIYVVNHYALLHTYIEAVVFMVSEKIF